MKSSLRRRRLIPKWRPIAATLETAEAQSTQGRATKSHVGNPDDFNKAVAEWRETKSPGLLGEVLSFSMHQNLIDKIVEIGNEALQNGTFVTKVQSALIVDLSKIREGIETPTAIIHDPAENNRPYQESISRLRKLLLSTPDNTLALLDYAQLQTANGKLKSAERALRTALSIAPNNRTVLRTAARFFVHTNQPVLAHNLIRRHQRTQTDPWLMASEIALADAAETESAFLSKGKRFLLEQPKFSPGQLTELAGAIAVAELRSGNMKRAREAQRKALLLPNDNVIAQAIELEKLFGIQLNSPQIARAITKSSEALVLQAWSGLTTLNIEKHAQAWHSEEPFSSRPIQMLTTIYAYKDEFEQANLWLQSGLLADPEDSGLLINQAFIQARMGKISEALSTMKKIRSLGDATTEPFAKATEGLLAYRSGEFDVGDELYTSAAMLLEKAQKHDTAAYCRLNQALSALDFKHPQVNEIMRMAQQKLEAYPSLDSAMVLKIRTAPEITNLQTNNLEKRRMSQWVYDPINNTLTERQGVTSIGAKPLVIIDRK